MSLGKHFSEGCFMNNEQIQHLPIFQNLDYSILTKLADHSSLKHYKKYHSFFIHGDSIEYFYIILSGWVKLFRNTLDGQEVLLGLARDGDIIGEVNFDKEKHLFSAQTISEADLLVVPYNILKDIIENNAGLALKIITALNSTINHLELQFEHINTMNAAQRVGCFILKLCDSKHPNNVELALPYDKMLIASYLGMKRETFSRALSDLKSIGITVHGNMLLIEDLNKLINFSCISCSLVYDACKD